MNRSLDFELDLKVPTSMLAGGSLAPQLTAAKKDVDLRVKIGGTYDAPKVSVGLGDAVKDIAAVADVATEQAKEVASDLVARPAPRATSSSRQRAAGDKLRATAKTAAAKVRDSADDQAKKLVKEAKGNPLHEATANEAAKKLSRRRTRRPTRSRRTPTTRRTRSSRTRRRRRTSWPRRKARPSEAPTERKTQRR